MSPDRTEEFRRLAWTTAGLVAALAPHLLRMRPWVSAFVLGAAAWRMVAELRGWRLPGTLARCLVAGAVTAGVILSYATITGLDGGTALLALMSALKLLETRTARDHTILIFIGWFLCLASFLYAQDILTTAWVLPTVWLLAAALLQISRHGPESAASRPFRTTGAMLAKAAPVALVLYLFFPRVEGSFWGAPSSDRALTGITEEMSPGDISELTLNDVVAFRARFQGAPPPPALRYWRGPVLAQFDGYTWSRGAVQSFFVPAVTHLGAPVDYSVTLEPTGQQMLFALDMVESWTPGIARQSWDFGLRTRHPVNAVLRFEARSYPSYRAGESLDRSLENASLQLPPGRNPRAAGLARRMRASAASEAEFVQAVLGMFRREEFYYTLTPPGLARDSVDDFLFNTRQGFCGHFASAFTAMMRAAGIPARVVAGYQGGHWNPIGGYLIVRQSHAHAWSEIWVEGSGWRRVDPTAAVAPERVERGIEAAFADSELLPGSLMRGSEWLWQAGMLWDNLNAGWNDWVVKFDRAMQNEILADLGFDEPGSLAFGTAIAVGLIAAVALVFAWLALEFRPRRADPAAAAYRRFLNRLERRGIERAVGEAPRDFAQRVRRLRPDQGLPALAITEAYLRLRYLPEPEDADLARLHALVARFRP
ncbi:MAG: transglutaminase TgpA family protein, partial [Steroidobacteraceae bacterium]